MALKDKPDYERDLAIDPDDLAEHLLNQSVLYFRYSELSAQATLDRDRAKDNFAQVQAQIDSDIRSFPEKYGISKVTETAIKSAVLMDKRYRAANEALAQAHLVSNTLEGATRAFDHRKKMLEKITDLKISGLYADPTTRKEVKSITSGVAEDKQNEALNRHLTVRGGKIRRTTEA